MGSGKDYGTNINTDYYGYDDVYIDFTQARLEMCDTASWSARTRCEIQTPQSWSANSITIKNNQGSFNNGDTAYLYVVDSAGAVNANGFSVIIGSGSQPDTTPPSAPIGVTVI